MIAIRISLASRVAILASLALIALAVPPRSDLRLVLAILTICSAAFAISGVRVLAQSLRHMAKAIGDMPVPDGSSVPEISVPAELEELASAVAHAKEHMYSSITMADADRRRAEAIIASIESGIASVNSSGRISTANAALAGLVGMSCDSLIGMKISEIIRSRDLETMVSNALEHGTRAEGEIKLKGVKEHVLRVAVSPLGNESRSGAVIVLSDFTELKRLEQIRSDFVANVSHELRTPLTSVRGFVETLLDGAMDEPETCRRFLSILDKETSRLARIVEDLMYLSRLEAKKSLMLSDEVDLYEAASDVVSLLSQRASAKGIRIQNELPPDLPQVIGNADMIQQVFYNLVENAIKYTPESGKITLSAEALPGSVKVEIADTGIGIPEPAIERIFERFYRVDKARSRELGGTGLGLSLVRHIVERHGGTVSVRSAEGKGSTFIFILPQKAPVLIED